MTGAEYSPLAPKLADRLRSARDDLTRRWLERISARVSLDPNRTFPTAELVDHVPLLIAGIADHLENPVHEIGADIPVVAKAMELGAMRYRQGFDAYQILKEYELLGSILYTFLVATVEEIDGPVDKAELMLCGHRLFRAIALVQQATTTQYLRLLRERIHERETRLKTFNQMVTHELKTRLNAVLGASQLLEAGPSDPAQQARFAQIISRNARDIQARLDSLLELSRIDEDLRQQKHVTLRRAAAEVARQLREPIEATGIDLRIAEDLPAVEVNAAAIELCLRNYVTNAIKYADLDRSQRWVEVTGSYEEAEQSCNVVVRVCDNGRGVPEEARARLFDRFFRVEEHTVSGIEGTGLGLSIVRDAVEALGGRAWAEFPERGGSVFAFSLPCRRQDDLQALQSVAANKPAG